VVRGKVGGAGLQGMLRNRLGGGKTADKRIESDGRPSVKKKKKKRGYHLGWEDLDTDSPDRIGRNLESRL